MALIRRTQAVTNRTPTASGSSIIPLPVGGEGLEYKHLLIALRKTNATTFWSDTDIDTYVDSIKVRLNGAPILDMPMNDFADLMGYKRSIVADQGVIQLRFAEIAGRLPIDEDAPAFGTLDVRSLEVEVKYASSLGALTAMQADAVALGNDENKPLLAYTEWQRQTPNVSGTTNVVTNLGELSPGDALGAVHIKNANVTRAELRVGGKVYLEDLYRFQKSWAEMNLLNPNSSWAHLDLSASRRLEDFAPAGGTIRLSADYSSDPAGAVTMYSQVAKLYRA